MKVIVCMDDRGGMSFNRRRQSRDRIVIKDIVDSLKGKKLWMNSYSASMFQTEEVELMVSDTFLDEAGEEDFCFVEDCGVQQHIQNIDEVIVYKWNRCYPADVSFDIDLKEWNKTVVKEFAGNSHEKITKETYEKACES